MFILYTCLHTDIAHVHIIYARRLPAIWAVEYVISCGVSNARLFRSASNNVLAESRLVGILHLVLLEARPHRDTSFGTCLALRQDLTRATAVCSVEFG